MRYYFFIDGGYLRRGLEDIDVEWRKLNLSTVAEVSRTWAGGAWQGSKLQLSRTLVYDAVDEEKADEPDSVGQWLKRNDDKRDIHVRYGRLAGQPTAGAKRRQKGVDVQLTVDALLGAINGVYDAMVLLAGDADFAPLVEAVRERGPLVAVVGFAKNLAPELRDEADRSTELPVDPNAWAGWMFHS